MEKLMEKLKVVFIGPPGVGKSTIRKLFRKTSYDFEVGIFELPRDIEDQNEIFEIASDVFISAERVIYISSTEYIFEENMANIKNIYHIIKKLNKDIELCVLINKVDLLSEEEIIKLKLRFLIEINHDDCISVYLTSFKDEFFSNTIQDILDLVQNAEKYGNKYATIITAEKEYGIIQKSLESNGILLSDLEKQLITTETTIYEIIKPYLDAKFVSIIADPDGEYLFPSPKGRKIFNNSMKPFINEIKSLNTGPKPNYGPIKTDETGFYGMLFSDDLGRTIMTYDCYPNALRTMLKKDNHEHFDIDLVSMFINALQKFGQEINIIGLEKFDVMGKDLALQSFTDENITMTVFSKSHVKFNFFIPHLEALFQEFISENEDNLRLFKIDGEMNRFQDYKTHFYEKINNLKKLFHNSKELTKSNFLEKSRKEYKQNYH